MNEITPSGASAQSGSGFDARGRSVGAGRGWDWIVSGWALFKRQPGLWILATVLLGILLVLVSLIPVLGSLANALLLPIISAGLMLGCQVQDRGGEFEIAHLAAGFKQNTGDLVMIGVLNLVGWLLIALALMAVIGGGVFMAVLRGGTTGAGISIASVLLGILIAAGLSVPLYMATWFAPALIMLNGLAPIPALKASFGACLRNWLPFLVYGIVMLVLGLACMITLGLAYLVLIPVIVASVYAGYRDIFQPA